MISKSSPSFQKLFPSQCTIQGLPELYSFAMKLWNSEYHTLLLLPHYPLPHGMHKFCYILHMHNAKHVKNTFTKPETLIFVMGRSTKNRVWEIFILEGTQAVCAPII